MQVSFRQDILRDQLLRLVFRLGLERALHHVQQSPACILMYHGVVPRGTRPALWTQLEQPDFDAQLRFLCEHRPVIPLETLIEGLTGTRSLEPGSVAITFDDGYVNILDQALPLLQKYRLPATLFMTMGIHTGHLKPTELLWFDALYDRFTDELENGQAEKAYARTRGLKRMRDQTRRDVMRSLLVKGDESPEAHSTHPRRLMNDAEVLRLRDSGLVTLGAHSLTHGILTQMAPDVARQEIQGSKQALEHLLGTPVTLFAYPDGGYDDTVVQLTREAGFVAALATRVGAVRPGDDLFTLRRYPIGRDTSLQRFKLTLAGLDDLVARVRARGNRKDIYG